MNQKPLVLPPDEIGWSDESFDLALRFVIHTTTLSEVNDMQSWLMKNIKQDIFWALGRHAAFGGIFKRTILLNFRNFEPSAMQNAYNYVKQNPRKNLKRSNAVAIVVTVGLSLFATLCVVLILFILVSNIVRN